MKEFKLYPMIKLFVVFENTKYLNLNLIYFQSLSHSYIRSTIAINNSQNHLFAAIHSKY